MSLFSSINTAISGLSAQSTAFGNISEDVANSQTAGFRRVDTSFINYLTTSTASTNTPGAVVAKPNYQNDVEGTISQSQNPLSLAIAGHGYFAVSQATSVQSGTPVFDQLQYYTRTGDFTQDANGYLVNSAGQYLNAWGANFTTNATTGITTSAIGNTLAPVKISPAPYSPIETSTINLSANLPATPNSGTATAASPLVTQVTVYDKLGTAHTVSLNWSQATSDGTSTGTVLPNDWNLQISAPDNTVAQGTGLLSDLGTADVEFAPNPLVTAPLAGTMGQITAGANVNSTNPATDTGSVGVVNPYTAGAAAEVTFNVNFGSGTQAIKLNLGNYDSTTGVTQEAGTTYTLTGLTQDGVPPGTFSTVSIQNDGNVVINYSNGQARTIAQVPVVTFSAPDQLQSQNGQAFTATPTSGSALAETAGVNGAGNLVNSSIEGSNVDIANEFSSLIVTQQAYSSNAKVVTTANQMLQATLQMIA